jgi:hypothetical protein
MRILIVVDGTPEVVADAEVQAVLATLAEASPTALL